MSATTYPTDAISARRALRVAERNRRAAPVIAAYREQLAAAALHPQGLLRHLDEDDRGALLRHGLLDFAGPDCQPTITSAGRRAIGRGREFTRRQLASWRIPFTHRHVSLVDVTPERPHPQRVRTYAVVTAAGVELGEVWREHGVAGRHWYGLAHDRYAGLRLLDDNPSATEAARGVAWFTHRADDDIDPWMGLEVDRDELF